MIFASGGTWPSLKRVKDQKTDNPKPPLEPSTQSGITSNQDEPDPPLRNRLMRPKCFDDEHPKRAGKSNRIKPRDV
jgi:hypothetical protein